MPYEQLEEIRSRKQEKIALFLTAQHMAGMLAVAMPVYIATLEFPFVLRTLIVIVAAILGVCLTLETGGLPLYERVLCRVRGAIRVRASGTTLSPDQFTGTATAHMERALLAGGPIRVVQADERAAKRRVQMGQALNNVHRGAKPRSTPISEDAALGTLTGTTVPSDRVDATGTGDSSLSVEAAARVNDHANV